MQARGLLMVEDRLIERMITLVRRRLEQIERTGSRAYFSEEEDQAMLAEFRAFDARMIHEKYSTLVRGLEGVADM